MSRVIQDVVIKEKQLNCVYRVFLEEFRKKLSAIHINRTFKNECRCTLDPCWPAGQLEECCCFCESVINKPAYTVIMNGGVLHYAKLNKNN